MGTAEDKITSTIKSITDFISTISSVTTISPTTVTEEDIEVTDNEIIPDVKEDEEDTTPFIVIIRISDDDLSSVLSKRVKVVVKDFMLMDMPAVAQQKSINESLSPK